MKLLIADDEDYTREGLMEEIPWKNYGFTEIMQARDGEMALKISRWFRPDVVLTDIRMPKLDGIAFATALTNIMENCKLIFMSGYVELEYLKSAIALDAVSYIEKPIDMEQLENAIKKAVADIKANAEKIQLSREKEELVKEKLVKILICKNADRELAERLSRETGFDSGNQYLAVVIREREVITTPANVVRSIEDYFHNLGRKSICDYTGERSYATILSFKAKEKEKILRELRSFSVKYPQYSVGAGVIVADIMAIYSSYDAAKLAINREFYHSGERFFELSDQNLRRITPDPGIFVEFMKKYREDFKHLKEWLDHFTEELKKEEYYLKEQVQGLYLSFALGMLKENKSLYSCVPGAVTEDDIEMKFRSVDSLEELQEILNCFVEGAMEHKQGNEKYSRVTRAILTYVENHYQEEDFRVQTLADYLHFSTTYLNVLFKNEMKVSLKQYICDYRLSQAKKMLENDFYKISEISGLCGYASPNYFTKAFKEEVGCTPLEYRERVTG